MLGRKQSVRNNEDWKNALDHIEETVPKKELDSLVKKTVKDIKEKCKGKKAAYAWSAGKDSLVLGEICEKAGIDQSVLVRCNLEYPAFIAWIEQNKPSGLEIINTGQDMEWLKKHPDMLFPDKSNKAAQWFHIVQHRGQARYYKEHQLEILMLGRRKADGNYVGKDNIYTNSAGITRYSPLAEWRHEDILAYIHYYDVKLPPIYDWENTAASRPVFPTPCPDLILTFGFAAKSLAASACHSSGSKLSTSRKNITGSFRHSGMLSSRNSENCISSIFVLSFPCFYHSFGPCTNNLIALAFSGNLLLFKSQLRKCFNSLGLL